MGSSVVYDMFFCLPSLAPDFVVDGKGLTSAWLFIVERAALEWLWLAVIFSTISPSSWSRDGATPPTASDGELIGCFDFSSLMRRLTPYGSLGSALVEPESNISRGGLVGLLLAIA